ncbi:MAG: glycoside hydrolase [Snowella sp.]|jgi:alpha-amylase/alpha-mannosidase (GH57 family)|nr:MAG: glycoside hydrolase [Snowella sp.]
MTAILTNSSDLIVNSEAKTPLKPTETGIYVTIHGHFYQPPRENPYLDTIERQPSASPFHDWNERIHHECYRPNAFARILNDRGEILKIVNNFEYLSFNIGPTLMSWLESYDLEAYQRIIDADRKSRDRLNGHGNAIAQVYNHIILPLANKKDKYTQIRWGKADFSYRFGRETEGMWLAETAVDYDTLEALIDENIRFIVLAPSQAERCRPLPTEHDPHPEWHEVGGTQIDPTRPYRCFIADGRFIDIFFYDGPISRDMGFNDVLSSSDHLAGRLGQAVRGDHRPSQLISVATDGETFGHHKGGTEKCLAYAFTTEFPRRNWKVTNFAHYLSLFPPQWEVVLKPVTAWSCGHGVDRWQDDCGCGGGGEWHQKWRRPLRDSLNWLRDELIKLYVTAGRKLFNDPWQAREDYIQVILDRSPEKTELFLQKHQIHPLTSTEKIDALRLLEMQRHSLLMFTSCGWFFEEISRPEGVQILRYASRAMELAAEVTGIHLEKDFVAQLAWAPSNVAVFKDGEAVYQQLVTTAQISFEQVAAHYAISSLFTNYAHQQAIYCYQTEQLDYQKQQLGPLTLAVGQVKLTSMIIWENHHFTFAVLHLGGWDFHCCIQPFKSRSAYSKLKEQVFASLKLASSAKIILSMSEVFGYQSFNLQNLFAEERHRIMQLLTQKTKKHLDQLYTQIYRDNYSILVAFQRDELPVPQELQVAADIAIAHRCLKVMGQLEQSIDNSKLTAHYLEELTAIATEADYLHCQLTMPEAKKTLERLIFQSLQKLLYTPEPQQAETDIHHLIKMIEVGEHLHLGISLAPAQELYYQFLHEQLMPNCLDNYSTESCPWTVIHLSDLLKLGEVLAIDVRAYY